MAQRRQRGIQPAVHKSYILYDFKSLRNLFPARRIIFSLVEEEVLPPFPFSSTEGKTMVMKRISTFLVCLVAVCGCLALRAVELGVSSDAPVSSAVWPPGCYEYLQVTVPLSDAPADALLLDCQVCRPDGVALGRYSAQVSESGTAVFRLDGGVLRGHGQEGAWLLRDFRLLTAPGFQTVPGTISTKSYSPQVFRPRCQSTLLTVQNGLRVTLEDSTATLEFTCPPDSDVLPGFFYQEDCVFDGFAVALDKRVDSLRFPADATGLFSTAAYTGLDVSRTLLEQLWEIGDRNGDYSPGETLVVSVPVEANPLPSADSMDPSEGFFLLLFYHCLGQRLEDIAVLKCHPFDTNQDLSLTKAELDAGRALWQNCDATHELLLGAVDLCDALAYGYDAFSECFYPIHTNDN